MFRINFQVAAVAVLVASCSLAPTTKDDVCAGFTALGDSFLSANGVFDNAVFNRAGDLSSLAARYRGGETLKADVDALDKISDSESTTGVELMNATTRIANLCGHPLALNSLPGFK